jgi:hypothetical protein
MPFACWVTKPTQTNSEYAILTAYPRQQWLSERASILRSRVHCLSSLTIWTTIVTKGDTSQRNCCQWWTQFIPIYPNNARRNPDLLNNGYVLPPRRLDARWKLLNSGTRLRHKRRMSFGIISESFYDYIPLVCYAKKPGTWLQLFEGTSWHHLQGERDHTFHIIQLNVDWDSSVGIVTRFGLDGSGIESRWRRDFPHPFRPAMGLTQPPTPWVPGLTRGKMAGAWS